MERSVQESFANVEIPTRESLGSGVSWSAVIAGGFVADAVGLLLLLLGIGLGFSAVSPWMTQGISMASLGAAAIAWLIVTQIAAFAFGGYVAGRLRTKWTSVHADEVYFRDTAHGLLVWAVGVVLAFSIVGLAGLILASNATSGAASGVAASTADQTRETPADPSAYFIDNLFRATPSPSRDDAATRVEAGRIFAQGLARGRLEASDQQYLAQVVAARTGVSQADAENRVAQTFADAQRAINAARKATAYASLWAFVALLAGAFTASYAATIGGRQRDNVKAI